MVKAERTNIHKLLVSCKKLPLTQTFGSSATMKKGHIGEGHGEFTDDLFLAGRGVPKKVVNKMVVRQGKFHSKASATISNSSLMLFPTFLSSFAIDCHTGEWCGSSATHLLTTSVRCSCEFKQIRNISSATKKRKRKEKTQQ